MIVPGAIHGTHIATEHQQAFHAGGEDRDQGAQLGTGKDDAAHVCTIRRNHRRRAAGAYFPHVRALQREIGRKRHVPTLPQVVECMLQAALLLLLFEILDLGSRCPHAAEQVPAGGARGRLQPRALGGRPGCHRGRPFAGGGGAGVR